MGTPLGPKYVPYNYMDPLGVSLSLGCRGVNFLRAQETK